MLSVVTTLWVELNATDTSLPVKPRVPENKTSWDSLKFFFFLREFIPFSKQTQNPSDLSLPSMGLTAWDLAAKQLVPINSLFCSENGHFEDPENPTLVLEWAFFSE